MIPVPSSIVLISGGVPETASLSEALRVNPAFDFEEHKSTLQGLNGKAIKLAADHDLIIFRTGTADANDLEALGQIQQNAKKKPLILALSDEKMTLAQVQKLRDAGVDDVFAESISPQDLEKNISRLLKKDAHSGTQTVHPNARMGQVVCVAQSRGGIGATMLAVNLADQLLHRKGRWKQKATKSVALLDLNLQFGSVGDFLDVGPNEVLYQLAMEGGEPDSTFVSQSMTRMESGLSVLAAPSQIAPLESLNKKQIEKLIETMRQDFDYVVIDLPHALVDWLEPVLVQSDLMLLVTDTAVPSVHQAKRLINFFSEVNPKLAIEIVVNFENKPLFKARHHAEAERVLERPLRHWLPYQSKVAKEALDRGVPLSQVSSGSAICKSIKRMAHKTFEAAATPLNAQQ